MGSEGILDSLVPVPDAAAPVTPQPPHATIDSATASRVGKVQANRVDNAAGNMTPPPSTQVPTSSRGKDRTPTPTFSSISTPPPTIDGGSQSQQIKPSQAFAAIMTTEQIETSSVEELRSALSEMQGAYQETKMSAAHYKLQYQMLSQESAAAIERMAVEARMTQYEDEVIHIAEQAKAAATPAQPSPVQEGMIPVQKDLYQRMCHEIQQLTEINNYLRNEYDHHEKTVLKQETQIESLTDRVGLMRERIRQNREHINRLRRPTTATGTEYTARSTYSTPHRNGRGGQDQFAALLQASEMASQEANPRRVDHSRSTSGKKSLHGKSVPAISSLPATPHRNHKPAQPTMYATPSRQHQLNVPSTAPLPRTSAVRTPDIYSHPSLPITSAAGPPRGMMQIPPAPQSEDTVSNSDREADSEAETDIIEPDEEIGESQASRAASLMLRSSQEGSFQGPRSGHTHANEKLKQTRLFGAVRKSGVDRDDEGRPTKRPRTAAGIGLGIMGAQA